MRPLDLIAIRRAFAELIGAAETIARSIGSMLASTAAFNGKATSFGEAAGAAVADDAPMWRNRLDEERLSGEDVPM